jgi:predicted enzyme related to lactoylglutathione lyase
MEVDSFKPGMFSWMELGTSDTADAKEFYAGLFGWESTDIPLCEDTFYTILKLNDNRVGALYHDTHSGAPPHWNIYFSVVSADESAAKAKELGGTVVAEPFDVMEFGRMAVILDPQGAAFCIWQARAHQGFDVVDEPGAFCWGELNTTDTANAIAFYTKLFGWGINGNQDGSSEYTEFKVGGQSIGGMMAIKEDWGNIPPHWLPYFMVTNCDDSAEQAKSLGANVNTPPMDIPGVGRFAMVADRQGANFAIFQLKHG